MTMQEEAAMFTYSGFQVSQIGSGAQPEGGKPLAKAMDEIIINPTPASCPASSEFHRPQVLSQPPVMFSKQKKKVKDSHKKVWEFLHYTIILNMFLLCSVITEKSRLGSQKGLYFQEHCPKLVSF